MFNKRSSSSFFKKSVFYTVYFFTGVIACLFAFILVVNFLTPALSEEASNPSEKEKITAKQIFKDIYKNLKTMISEISGNIQEPSPESEKDPHPSQEELSDIQKLENTGDAAEDQLASPEVEEGAAEDQLASPEVEEGAAEDQLASPEVEEGAAEDQLASPEVEEGAAEDQLASPGTEENLPSAPTNFEGDAYGKTLPSPSPTTGQTTSDKNSSEASIEVQSYMAPFIYESIQQKDPFEDPTIEKSEGVVIVPKTPPEEYDLSEIKLKGITWRTKVPKALFELPNNAGHYTLRAGDKIGKKGTIFKIAEDGVFIVEVNYLDSDGDRKEERTIKVKKMNRIGLSI